MDFSIDKGFDALIPEEVNPRQVRKLFHFFAVFLRETRLNKDKSGPISSTSIDQYISHVTNHLVEQEILTDSCYVRSRFLGMLLTGYKRIDYVDRPIRLTAKIPVNYVIACVMHRLAGTLFPGTSNKARRSALRAALALAYGLSLRPGEYLNMGKGTLLKKQVNSSLCFFVFGASHNVSICTPHLYPLGQMPTDFYIMSTNKNNPRGECGPRAVTADPHPNAEHFCCVRTLWSHYKRYPAQPNTFALSSHGEHVPWGEMRMLCHHAAIECDLDPLRLLPHSLRSGVNAQIELESEERRIQQGGWHSYEGMSVYDRKMLAHARSIAALVHDHDACPLELTHSVYTDHIGRATRQCQSINGSTRPTPSSLTPEPTV